MRRQWQSFLWNMSSALLVRELRWSAMRSQLQQLIPALSYDSHKGQMGRVGVVGGSVDYTGAPYYVGKASLMFGADLVFIFCAQEALIPIKSYSPEFMVTSLYDGQQLTEEFDDSHDNDTGMSDLQKESIMEDKMTEAMVEKMQAYMWKLHVVVMGPGLGRASRMVPGLLKIIDLTVSENKSIVLDADAIWVICHDLDSIRGHQSCVLSPNIREFDMLVKRSLDDINTALHSLIQTNNASVDENFLVNTSESEISGGHCKQEKSYLKQNFGIDELETLRNELMGGNSTSSDDTFFKLRALSRSLGGVTIILKGRSDTVCAGDSVLQVMDEAGSPRRCGGQGDILAGTIAVTLHWVMNVMPQSSSTSAALSIDGVSFPPTVAAAVLSTIATKRAAALAYSKHGRSTTSPDILDELGTALVSLEKVL